MDQLEKQQRFSWRDIVALVGYLGMQFVVPFIAIFVAILVYGFTNGGAVEISGNVADIPGVSTALTWSMVITNVLSLLLVWLLFKEYLQQQWKQFIPNWKRNGLYIIVAYIFTLVFEYVFSTYIYTEVSSNQLAIIEMFESVGIINLLLLNLGIIICAPVVEEIIFRKVIFGNFKNKKILNILMFVLSSLAFGIAHYAFDQSIMVIVPYVTMGAIMAGVYWKTDNLFTAIGLHVVNNAIASMIMLIGMLS